MDSFFSDFGFICSPVYRQKINLQLNNNYFLIMIK